MLGMLAGKSAFKCTKHTECKKKACKYIKFVIEQKLQNGKWQQIQTPAALTTKSEADKELDRLNKEFRGCGASFRYVKA